MRVIVVGGVAAGMSAASKIKRNLFNTEVVVYEKGEVLSYGACGMPYLISDVIKEPESLIARKKEHFEKMGIDIFLSHEVVKIDDKKKEVTVKQLETGRCFQDRYDKLLVSSGASPIIPNVQGIDLNGIETLSTYADGIRLKQIASKQDVQNVCIVGAGFIGVELVEAMLELNKNVTLVEFKNQILPQFDKEVVLPLQDEMIRKGAALKLSEKVVAFKGDTHVKRVITDKNSYEADLVIVCIGVRPNTQFLKDTKVELLGNGAVKVNKRMESSVPDIYAAGDCATVYHQVLDTLDAYIPLGTNANKQGRIVGEVISGNNAKFEGAMGTSMIKVCGMEAAKTGISEREAIDNNFDYKAVTINGLNHASYYPDNTPVMVKLIYQAYTKRILGAQIMGYQDAAIRIDIIALAIHAGIKTYELAMIDFGYSPPFSGVWDVIHIAANQAK